MSSVGNLVAARRPEGGGRSDEVWSDVELPGWQEFVGARERFFEGLRRLERPVTRERADEHKRDAGEGRTEA
ncbi:MAG: hypothetical protein AB7O78_05220 [Thermoleophilia bacterium]